MMQGGATKSRLTDAARQTRVALMIVVWLVLVALLAACAPAVEDTGTDPGPAAPGATAAPPAAAPARAPTVASAPRDRLVVALPFEVPGFDPRQAYDGRTSGLVGVMLEPLVALQRDFSLQPRLAAGWEVADEGRRLTLRLREGVTFHDGRPFTAEDVRFTIESGMASEERNTVRRYLSEVTSVEVVDDATVVLHAENPSGGLLLMLASVPIMPAGSGEDFDAHPIGTGPFAFVRHDAGSSLLVERFDGYWGPMPSVLAVEFRVVRSSSDRAAALLSGNAHLSQSSFEADDEQRLRAHWAVSVTRTEGTVIWYLAFNVDRPPFDDPDVRRALNHLIPRERIIRNVYQERALPAVSMLLPGTPWLDPDGPTFAYDVRRARDLVEASGAEFDRTYRVLTNDHPVRISKAEAMIASFEQVGMRAEVEVVSFSSLNDRIHAADFDVHLQGLITGANVPRLLGHFGREFGLFNRGGFRDPEVEAMLDEALTLDPMSPEAIALYQGVANRLVEASANVFVAYDVVVGAARNEVEGWWPHPLPALAYQDLHLVRVGR